MGLSTVSDELSAYSKYMHHTLLIYGTTKNYAPDK